VERLPPKGTRVPVKTLFDYLIAGDTVDDFPTVEREVVMQVLKLTEILPNVHRPHTFPRAQKLPVADVMRHQ
jgi:hypothetical protein